MKVKGGVHARNPAVQPVEQVRPASRPVRSSRLLALQRAVGNHAVAHLVHVNRAPDPAPPKGQPAPRVNYVFIVGDMKNDVFYRNAKGYFEQERLGKVVAAKTLTEILDHVNKAGKPVGTLYIVSHANDAGDLSISLDAADLRNDIANDVDHLPRLEYHELKRGNAGGLPVANVKLIDERTRIEIRGCDIGRSQLTLEELDKAFGGRSQVTAPTHGQSYAQRGSRFEETMSDYYVEEPGTVKKNAAQLKSAFTSKYPFVPAKSWPALLKGVKKEPTKLQMGGWTGKDPPADDARTVIALMDAANKFPKSDGWVLKYKGRTRSGGRYTYTVLAERVTKGGGSEWEDLTISAEVPPTGAELIAKAKAESGRPDAYTWSVARTVNGTDLDLAVFQERTEWVIHGEISDRSGPIHPPPTDPGFYRTSSYAAPSTR